MAAVPWSCSLARRVKRSSDIQRAADSGRRGCYVQGYRDRYSWQRRSCLAHAMFSCHFITSSTLQNIFRVRNTISCAQFGYLDDESPVSMEPGLFQEREKKKNTPHAWRAGDLLKHEQTTHRSHWLMPGSNSARSGIMLREMITIISSVLGFALGKPCRHIRSGT